MVVTTSSYGLGALYGTVDLYYGRTDPDIVSAQADNNRQTTLRVRVLDTHINDWEYIAGTALTTDALPVATVYSFVQAFYAYRLQMGMCVLSNGHIIRVRVGDGSASNRNIYVNDIADPTNAADWTSWSLLYSGTFYAVDVVPATASTYHVYHADSTGVRKNNVAKQTLSGIIYISAVQGTTDAMFATRVFRDSLDGRRVMDVHYSSNIESLAFSDDELNYRWVRTEISAVLLDDGRVARLQVAGWNTDPRSTSLGESLTITFNPTLTNIRPVDPPRLIRGFAGQAGSNAITHPYLTKLADDFYYIFYGESRFDASKDNAISVATLFWQRSKDLLHWSEPLAIGYDAMSPTDHGHAIVEVGGYVYLANNGASWKRPTATTTYDLSNYIPSLEINIPATLEEGSASFTVANPDGINDYLIDLTDREMTIEVGLKLEDGSYGYVEVNDWWIDRAKREMQNKVNRIVVTAYDIQKRLQNQLRDVLNFPGQVVWNDWYLGRRNKLFNYYIRGGVATIATSPSGLKYYGVTRVNRSQLTLYTGWKGHNFDLSVRFRGGTFISNEKFGITYRYQNGKNYYWAHISGTTLILERRRNNVKVTLASYAIGSLLTNPTITVITRFGFHYVYINYVLRITYNESIPSVSKPGYVGIRYYRPTTNATFGVDLFNFKSWETAYTSDDLIATALATAGLHDYSIDAGDTPQVAVVWGPQTDLNSPFAALSSMLSQLKLDMAWRDDIITVGQFKELSISKTIQNESIDFKVTEETGRRINLAIVDGQEDTFTAIDGTDSRARGRQIVAYFDIPELETTEKVVDRANEEIRKGVIGVIYEGQAPFFFDLWRMDAVTWYDPEGTAHNLRIDGIKIEINQSTTPSQRGTYTLSPLT